jgi:hypothetical protein
MNDKYPTMHALGLGPALDEVEKVFAIGANGKYKGKKIDPRQEEHLVHACNHLTRTVSLAVSGESAVDPDTGQRDLAHVGARTLLAMVTSGVPRG